MIEVKINPSHKASGSGTYPVQDPPMILTKEWQSVVKLTSELRELSLAYPGWPALILVQGQEGELVEVAEISETVTPKPRRGRGK